MTRISLIIYLSIVVLPSSCEKIVDYVNNLSSNEIQLVKSYKPYKAYGMDLNLEELFARLVGVKGRIMWGSFKPKALSNRPDIGLVQIKINTEDEKRKNILIQYLVNNNTKSVEFYTAIINDKPISKMEYDLMLVSKTF